MENVTDIAFFMVCKQVNFKITHIRSLVSFFVAVSARQERARDAIWQFRDMGRPFEEHNALTCSWSVLRFPILPVVWFQYYCELKDFVWTSEGDSTLYIQGTAYALWPHFMDIYAWRGAGLPRFDSRTRHHMWVEFVVGSLLCSERFFSGYSGFPLSLKTNISKFQFDPGMHEHFMNEFLWTP